MQNLKSFDNKKEHFEVLRRQSPLKFPNVNGIWLTLFNLKYQVWLKYS